MLLLCVLALACKSKHAVDLLPRGRAHASRGRWGPFPRGRFLFPRGLSAATTHNTANSHSNNASEMGVAIAVAWHLNGLHTAARGCKLNFLICC